MSISSKSISQCAKIWSHYLVRVILSEISSSTKSKLTPVDKSYPRRLRMHQFSSKKDEFYGKNKILLVLTSWISRNEWAISSPQNWHWILRSLSFQTGPVKAVPLTEGLVVSWLRDKDTALFTAESSVSQESFYKISQILTRIFQNYPDMFHHKKVYVKIGGHIQ